MFWWIYPSNKSAPANRKKGFYTNRNPNKQEVGFIFVWSGSELWSLFKYSKVKLKKQKHRAADVLFNDTTVMQIYSGQTVPLSTVLQAKEFNFKNLPVTYYQEISILGRSCMKNAFLGKLNFRFIGNIP
jgi:hypothetical protein